MDVPGKRCFFSICEDKHCMRNSVRRDIFIPGLEANPWIEVLNETNQNGFYSQIPVRRSAQTELQNGFRSRPSIGKTAVCSQHVSGQRRELLPGEDICCFPVFSHFQQPATPCSDPLGEILPLFNSMDILTVIWPRLVFCPESFLWAPQNNSTILPGLGRAVSWARTNPGHSEATLPKTKICFAYVTCNCCGQNEAEIWLPPSKQYPESWKRTATKSFCTHLVCALIFCLAELSAPRALAGSGAFSQDVHFSHPKPWLYFS